jgi:glycosyltransferase involved in cell wall biosynthesis
VNSPLVSVIIPTYNSDSTLMKTLNSLSEQSYHNFETIIVDKGSTDNTENIAISFNVIFYTILAKERSQQVNFGIRKSKGKYVYRIDSDFILDKNIIKAAVYESEKYNYDAIIIHNTSDPSVSFWSKVRKLERDCYKNDDLNVAVRFFKKDVIEQIGLFDESLIASEDYDVHNRLLNAGYKIGRIEQEEIHIGEPKNLKEIVLKHFYYGKNIKKFILKNEKRGIKQLSPIRISYFRNINRFFNNPILLLGFLTYQIIRYYSAFFGLVYSLIRD